MNVGWWLHLINRQQTINTNSLHYKKKKRINYRGFFPGTYGDVSLSVKGSRLVTSSALRAQKILQQVNEGGQWVEIIQLRI